MLSMANFMDRRYWVAIFTFVAFPVLFIAYNLFAGAGGSTYTLSTSVAQLLVAVLALGEIGVLIALGGRFRLRVAPGLALAFALASPWVVGGGIVPGEAKMDTGYVLLLYSVLWIVSAGEVVYRYPLRTAVDRTVDKRVVLFGGLNSVGGALAHLSTRDLSMFVDQFWTVTVPLLVSGVVMFVIGGGALLVWQHHRLIAPPLAVVGWLSWGMVGTWTLVGGTAAGQFQAIDWSALRPYPDYLLSWPVLLVFLTLLVGLEVGTRVAGARLPEIALSEGDS